MNTFELSVIKDGISFNKDVLLDMLFIIEPAGVPLPKTVIAALAEWEFSEVISEGNVNVNALMSGRIKAEPVAPTQDSPALSSGIKRTLEDAERMRTLENSDQARLAAVQNVYDEYMDYIDHIYTHYATHKQIDYASLEETVRSLCVFIRENRTYVLRITPSDDTIKKNFIVTHSMRSTVLAIAIGLQLHMSLSKLVELGASCILHEIGMLRLPPQLYLSNKQLSPAERDEISKHPLIGFEIAKTLQFPVAVQFAIFEHHERENGTGYPRGLTGDKISLYAKIIAVVCSFESIIAPRQYKSERSTFAAMVEMLKNENRQYDETVIKALLYSISLFPIGTYVYLSNGETAQVVDVNPDNPKNPIVQLLGEKDADGSPKTLQTDDNDIKIIRPIDKQELEDVMKALTQRESGEAQTAQTGK
ncbi:HD-GYP domain-containing protein [Treponema sp. Marseille-Q4130]|uniref:HD-GYP domain-containing protein n=1 Tax=Treponema sp. Marseille-Q4130 TaxID=2766702 RepID=UPI0016522DDB|nr:HD domain-containing phosphohydrolase [Treponema sp. Marseille-Q4130]MBC6721045.1 HD domain-containing protein [Treponema sp. Marseille-Q4130]